MTNSCHIVILSFRRQVRRSDPPGQCEEIRERGLHDGWQVFASQIASVGWLGVALHWFATYQRSGQATKLVSDRLDLSLARPRREVGIWIDGQGQVSLAQPLSGTRCFPTKK